jgi:phosphotransferase system  glucose/maltose/N-acetylglucosamine-specific IIC component
MYLEESYSFIIQLLQNISSTWMSNPYKATLYSLDSEVEIEGLSMFSKITDTELYFIFYILYFIFYILYFIFYILYFIFKL